MKLKSCVIIGMIVLMGWMFSGVAIYQNETKGCVDFGIGNCQASAYEDVIINQQDAKAEIEKIRKSLLY